MKTDVVYSSKNSEWATPQDFFDDLNEEFGFTLDPCATDENHKCEKYYTKADDGLSQDWLGEVVFCNPPYGRDLPKWVRKCFFEVMYGMGRDPSVVFYERGGREMNENKKHAPPLRCRIRLALVSPSPSAVAWCGLGLRRTTRLCEGCRENRAETIWEGLQAGLQAGLKTPVSFKISEDGKIVLIPRKEDENHEPTARVKEARDKRRREEKC